MMSASISWTAVPTNAFQLTAPAPLTGWVPANLYPILRSQGLPISDGPIDVCNVRGCWAIASSMMLNSSVARMSGSMSHVAWSRLAPMVVMGS